MLTAFLLLSSTTTPPARQFAVHALVSLVRLNPAKQFLFIHDSPEDNELSGLSNVECFRLTLNRKLFLFKWRLRNKVASVLAQKGATKLLTTIPFPAINVPQYYFGIPLTGKKPQGKLQHMKGIIVTSEKAKTDLEGVTGFDGSRVLVVYGGSSSDANSLLNADASMIRETYTDGKPYFLCKEAVGDDLVYMLKAFSKFKKRQKSEMKLVVVKSLPAESVHDTLLLNYRYKNDVVLINPAIDISLVAAAYALIILSKESYVPAVLDAMSASVPVLVPHGSPVEEWGADIALHYANDNIDDLAEKLMVIYKNENLWLKHGKAGKETALLFTWERTSGAIAHMLFENEHD